MREDRVTDVISSAFNDALPLLRSRIRVYGVLAALCAVGGILLLFVNVPPPDPANPNAPPAWLYRYDLAANIPNVFGFIAFFFALPAVVRTERPDFRMTAGWFFGFIGIAIAIGIVVELGFILFVIPGIFIFVKWSQAIWCYFLSEGRNPFGESWEITKGHFWPTLGFLILLGLATGVPMVVLFFGAVVLATALPLLGFLCLPIAFFVYVYVLHVTFLGQIRWMLQLRRPALPVTVLATAAP